MDSEDDRPAAPTPPTPDLGRLGIRELEAYIADLEAEIERARAMIDAKKSVRGQAESLFRR
jgi:uncharacterized small protein (DUF1192 family)